MSGDCPGGDLVGCIADLGGIRIRIQASGKVGIISATKLKEVEEGIRQVLSLG
jgi:hypothetical protein